MKRFTIPKTGVYLVTLLKDDVILSETIEVKEIPQIKETKSKVAEDWIAGDAYWPETPESKEKWIEEKARELLNSLFTPSVNTHCYLLPIIITFLHELVEEIQGRSK